MGKEQPSNNDDENETGHTSALPISKFANYLYQLMERF